MNNEESILASGYIYVFTDTAFPDCVKVGMSINPVKRLSSYNCDKPLATTKPYAISKPFKTIFTVEQRILKVLNEKLTKSSIITSKEWFDIKDIEYITTVLNQAESFFELEDTLPLLTIDSFTDKQSNKIVYESATAKLQAGKVPNFSDLCKDYFTADNTQREFINKVEPIIEEAFNTLGQNKMEALNCQKGKIKKELLLKDNMKGLETKIITLLGLEVGKFYSLVTIKESLQVIYADLGIIKTAKASDLNQWYSVKNTMRRVDSLPTKGIAVITCNIK